MIDDRFDRLASLFLGDHEPTPTDAMEALMGRAGGGGAGVCAQGASAGASGQVALITPLVPGNLPVLAHPWIWHVAARLDSRPSALLRLASDGVQVAMLNASGPAESTCSDLAAWLLQAATVARRWFVVPRSGGEIDTVSALQAEEAVVVSGGDTAATVAAYQWVRRMVEAARNAGRTAPLTPIAIVGCEEPAAKEAAATVSTASQAFLQQPVPLAGAFPRLERTSVSEQRFFEEVVEPSVLLAAIRTAGAAAWARSAAQQSSASTPRPAAPAAPVSASTPALPARIVPPTGIPAMAPVPASLPRPTVEATPSVAASTPAPAPVAVATPEHAAVAPESFASWVPGLLPMSIRCPDHAQVEFATDAQGNLHVLATLEHAASLRLARAWAFRQAAILRAGFPGLSAEPLAITERVVFLNADAPRAADWHHTGVRLDLLVGSGDRFVHVALSDERSMQG